MLTQNFYYFRLLLTKKYNIIELGLKNNFMYLEDEKTQNFFNLTSRI